MNTTVDAKTVLRQLAAELDGRGWRTRLLDGDPPTLQVTNPNAPRLNDVIACDGDAFRWAWGQGIGPVSEVEGVADRIMHVLREVAE